jgi:hypothetical protein
MNPLIQSQEQTMKKGSLYIILALTVILAFTSCVFRPPSFNCTQAFDNEFGDQYFKTAIALIELHKIRYGEYPEKLRDLKFVGEWDQLALQSVAYEKVGEGYILEVTRGWTGKPNLTYPPEFWQGLGIIQEND